MRAKPLEPKPYAARASESVERRRPRRLASAAVSLALIAAVAAIYGRVAGHAFVHLDDDGYILENPMVRRLSWEGVVWSFTHFEAANWHPLTWLSHMVDGQLFGVTDAGAGGHHLASAGLHALNAVLLFLALRRMTGGFWPSALVAGLFAVHPLRVESVAWASERKDVLSGFFFMLTLIAYDGYARRPGAGRYACVAMCLAAGLLAKPMLVTVPAVLLLLDIWPLGRWRLGKARRTHSIRETKGGTPAESPQPLSALILEKMPLLGLCLASAAVTIVAQRQGGAMAALQDIPPAWRLVMLPIGYAMYLLKTIWPSGLAPFYAHPGTLPEASIGPWLAPAAASGLLLVAATAAAVRWARRRPYVLVGWLWFLGMLVPVIGLLQVGTQAWADRYAYLPLIGIYLIAAFGLHEVLSRHRVATVLATATASGVLLALGVVAWRQVGAWRDSRTLFEHSLRVTRNNWMIQNNLGMLLALEGNFGEARSHLEEALRIQPASVEAHNNLGFVLLRQGSVDEARRQCEQALTIRPDFAPAHLYLAYVFLREGKTEEARSHLERSLAIDPDQADVHLRLGNVLRSQGKPERARDHYAQALRLEPDDVDTEIALAGLLAVWSEASPSDRAQALALARRAAERTQYRRPGSLATLAAACAANGRFDEAVRWMSQAVALAPESLQTVYRAHLDRFRNGKPLVVGSAR